MIFLYENRNEKLKMDDNQVDTVGKSTHEIAYMLMKDLLSAKDGQKKNAGRTRNEILEHYAVARNAVSGDGRTRF